MTGDRESFGQETEYDDLLSAEETRERKRIERQLALEQTEIERIEQENLEHPIEEEPEAPSEKQKLQRELRAEALARLEHAARTPEDFQKVIAWCKASRKRISVPSRARWGKPSCGCACRMAPGLGRRCDRSMR